MGEVGAWVDRVSADREVMGSVVGPLGQVGRLGWMGRGHGEPGGFLFFSFYLFFFSIFF